MSAQDLGPLDWRVAITDGNGRPTPEFQRRWNIQRNNNALIGSIAFGSGVPTGTPNDGAEYVNIGTTPYTLYIGNNGTWNKVGVSNFTDLGDVPHTYTGDAGEFVRVNSGATGLTFGGIVDADLSGTTAVLAGSAQSFSTTQQERACLNINALNLTTGGIINNNSLVATYGLTVTSNPLSAPLSVVTNVATGIGILGVGASAAPSIDTFHARGSVGSYTATLAGDYLFNLVGGGYNGSAFVSGIAISGIAQDAFTSSDYGSVIYMQQCYTGSTTLTGVLSIYNGSVIIGSMYAPAALSTTATSGYLYVPSVAGTPTGTPVSFSPLTPIVFNTASSSLYAFNPISAAWVNLSGGSGGGGPAFHPGYVSGRWYCPHWVIGSMGTQSLATGTLYAVPVYIGGSAAHTFTGVGAYQATSVAAGVDIGLYTNNNGAPGTLVVDFGAITTAASATAFSKTISQSISPGWYWLAIGVSATISVYAQSNSLAAVFAGEAAISNAISPYLATGSWTYSAGGMPATFPTLTWVLGDQWPVIWLQG